MITEAEAVRLAESGWWVGLPARDVVQFQLFTPLLCMDFHDFHVALEEVLGRSVFTHELGLNYAGICAEFLGERPAPTFEQILELIPLEKRVLVWP